METTKEISTINSFETTGSFELAQRMAKALSTSDLVPKAYKDNVSNTMIALELANRTGVSPIMVMQNLNVIQGKPSWSSSFIIAVINSYKKFTMPLNFDLKGDGDKRSCIAWTTGINGQRFESPEITMSMAAAEGWLSKPGSKWKTMPDLMLRYRAAAFFGRLYCPELLMGMHSDEEVIDITARQEPVDKEAERLTLMLNDCKTIEDVELLQGSCPDVDVKIFEAKKAELKGGANGK